VQFEKFMFQQTVSRLSKSGSQTQELTHDVFVVVSWQVDARGYTRDETGETNAT